MFCPKCGTQGIAGTKFCRSCGTDLETVSAALTGRLALPEQKSGKKKDDYEMSNDPDKLWSSVLTNGLTGLAFVIIALYLTFTNTIGGSVWGFWLLIPGGGTLGKGLSSYMKLKRLERQKAELGLSLINQATFPAQGSNASLPPQTLFGGYTAPPARNTGELVMPPVSVTENTTRHLEINTEGETINLPSQK